MSLDLMVAERVGYVDCNFCNTVLAVIVPHSNSFTIGTVRCGHCSNMVSVNISTFLQVFPAQNSQLLQLSPGGSSSDSGGSSSKSINAAAFESLDHEPPRLAPIPPPEKRQRVPSAYNRFIKDEIHRIKAGNPEISHREAFSTAAKNWARFPYIHIGSKTAMDGNKQARLDHAFAGGEGTNKKAKSNAFY